MSPRTDFSSYDIVIDGRKYSGRDAADIRLIRKGENMPVKGIVSSELIISLKTAETFTPNCAVRVSSEEEGIGTGTHFISRITRKGDIVTIHAFDRMRMTENEFIDDDFPEEDQPYHAFMVIEAIAAQCGFAHAASGFSGMDTLMYEDIHGKKCREILETLSENAPGAWYCSDREELKFTPFLSSSVSVSVNREMSAPLYLHSVKGPFEGVAARNRKTSDWHRAGELSDFRKVLKLAGSRFDDTRTGAVMTRIHGGSFRSFYCAHADIDFLPCGLTEFIFGDVFGLISVKTTVRFTAFGIYAEAQTADICEDASDYTDAVGYELRRRIEQGRLYGSAVITHKGVGIGRKEDMENGEISFFSALPDRLAGFDGALIDGRMPDSVVSLSDTEKLIRYGGSILRLTFDIGADGSKTNIRLERSASS